MSFRSLPTKCWIAFLILNGFKRDRTKGSHYIWTKPGCLRPIVVREADKDVPAPHIKTGCSVIGVSMDEVYEWMKNNC